MADAVTKGSCNCGDWTYEFSGAPLYVAMCHCKPCQKTAGTNGSVNIVIKEPEFKKLTGHTYNWSRTGESGKSVEYTFCAKCCTFLTVGIESMPGLLVVKAGTVDGPKSVFETGPVAEIYTRNRPDWCTAQDGVNRLRELLTMVGLAKNNA